MMALKLNRTGRSLLVPGLLLMGAAPAAAIDVAMDDSFRAGVQGVSATLARSDAASALQQARSLLGTADQPFEKYMAGQLALQAAGQLGDMRAQRAALNDILESGATPVAEVPKYRAMAGELSAMLGDPRDSAAQIAYANQLGLQTAETQFALADARFQLGDAQAATEALRQAIALRKGLGKAVPTVWYDRAAAMAYRQKRPDLGLYWMAQKLSASAQPEVWRSAVLGYAAVAHQPAAQQLDLYRLLAATGALAAGRDWLGYASAAIGDGQATEARAAVDAGIKSGDVDAADAETRKVTAAYAVKTTGKAKAKSAVATADAAFAAAEYPKAALAYRALLDHAKADERDRLLTRYGIALARSGDLVGGRAALMQVTASSWAPVATLWTAWIDQKTTVQTARATG